MARLLGIIWAKALAPLSDFIGGIRVNSVLGLGQAQNNVRRKESPSGNFAERWIIGLLTAMGALMFFFPLLSFHIPIVGDVNYSGYDLVSHPGAVSNRLSSKSTDAETEQQPTR